MSERKGKQVLKARIPVRAQAFLDMDDVAHMPTVDVRLPIVTYQADNLEVLAYRLEVSEGAVARAAIQMFLEAYKLGEPDNDAVRMLMHDIRAEHAKPDSVPLDLPDGEYLAFKPKVRFVPITDLHEPWARALSSYAYEHFRKSTGRGTSPSSRNPDTGKPAMLNEALMLLYIELRESGFTPKVRYTVNLKRLAMQTGVPAAVLMRSALHLFIEHHDLADLGENDV